MATPVRGDSHLPARLPATRGKGHHSVRPPSPPRPCRGALFRAWAAARAAPTAPPPRCGSASAVSPSGRLFWSLRHRPRLSSALVSPLSRGAATTPRGSSRHTRNHTHTSPHYTVPPRPPKAAATPRGSSSFAASPRPPLRVVASPAPHPRETISGKIFIPSTALTCLLLQKPYVG